LAAAVRLTGPGARLVAAVGLGSFGQKVASLLCSAHGGCTLVAEGAVESAFRTAADVVVVAMWRPAPSLCELADKLSFSTGRPWVPVIMEQFEIHAGPAVVPPGGPCYRCFLRRRAQHDMRHHSTAALHAEYDRDASCGPAGYLPQHARMAAGVAKTMLDAALACGGSAPGGGVAGGLVNIRLGDYSVSRDHVVPCHDCERCHARDPQASHADLLRLVGDIRAEGSRR
jgi:bacteriocin biosynthesis cyclodehydratase domain-containing protein